MQRRSQLEETLQVAEEFQCLLDDVEVLMELAKEGENAAEDIQNRLSKLNERLVETEFKALLSGPHDRNNAIVRIHPGAGGTESQDWAEMLSRMYLR